MGLTNMPISEWKTRWMLDIGDILICLEQQNGWSTPTPLPDMFVRFPPLGKKDGNDGGEDDYDDSDDEEEETPIAPLDYERVFRLEHLSTKGVVIYDPSHHNPTQTFRRQH
ncbi:hypothetical protein PVK06_020995 [Gossypium arboreum]|uniref:Uncharacterized protein n=1 Tax=Gossypium arboreum TaxID=29729 RepID=A0ABR0PP93_GOSAR|nr:hypothetical protein PVK06_020995 [Gossypium arboreum]